MSAQEDPLDGDETLRAVSQLSATYAKAQDDYDQSIRLIASGAVAVSAGLVASLGVGWSGGLAIAFAITALTANLLSYASTQIDTGRRMDRAWEGDRAGVQGDGWTTITKALNVIAGVGVIATGGALLVFVATHS